MLRLNLNLSKYLHFLEDSPLVPPFDEIKRVKRGSKISRFFRYVFEHRSVKWLLGTNLALGIILSSFFPIKSFDLASAESAVIQEKIAPLTTERKIQTPVKEFTITQGYALFHPGVDLAAPFGTPVYPIMAGRVRAVDSSRYGYGNAVIIEHSDKLSSLYAHLSEIDVAEGEEVTTLTEIGKTGSTGHSSGPHVHLEIRDDGRPVSPFSVVPLP